LKDNLFDKIVCKNKEEIEKEKEQNYVWRQFGKSKPRAERENENNQS
jgi:hypothetical protein